MSSQTSRRSQSSSQRRSFLCDHGEPSVLRVSGTKDNPGRRFWGCRYYQVSLSFLPDNHFDPPQEDGCDEIAKLKKKVGTLKLRVKTAEWRLKVALVVGLVGWVSLLSLWVYDSAKMKPPYVMPLKVG
ncbi:hypothetical protein PIB30_064079 [Stylosanthes scabra]|uniref:Zinc finger GRF-type domain-containing protein n=1 Tax=Stylosanthes scabra TaxID=79078 RepID=A0ABU6VP03_9FABA|nr:hypothetical protein [Stylosanthes scabra]